MNNTESIFFPHWIHQLHCYTILIILWIKHSKQVSEYPLTQHNRFFFLCTLSQANSYGLAFLFLPSSIQIVEYLIHIISAFFEPSDIRKIFKQDFFYIKITTQNEKIRAINFIKRFPFFLYKGKCKPGTKPGGQSIRTGCMCLG